MYASVVLVLIFPILFFFWFLGQAVFRGCSIHWVSSLYSNITAYTIIYNWGSYVHFCGCAKYSSSIILAQPNAHEVNL